MRAVLALALTLLVGCATSLQTHATIARSTALAIDDVGAAINAEIQADWEAIGGRESSYEQKVALAASYEPVRAAYRELQQLHSDYVEAIRDASKRGDVTLVQAPARTLLAAWQQLEALAKQFGVTVPPAPGALTKAGGP